MIKWHTTLLLSTTLFASCRTTEPPENHGLNPVAAAAVRNHVEEIEKALQLVPWCGTTSLYHARRIDEYGEAGWKVAAAVFADPNTASELRAFIRSIEEGR